MLSIDFVLIDVTDLKTNTTTPIQLLFQCVVALVTFIDVCCHLNNPNINLLIVLIILTSIYLLS